MWLLASVLGKQMNLRGTVLGCTGMGLLCLGLWFFLSIKLDVLMAEIGNMDVVSVMLEWSASDCFVAWAVCMMSAPTLAFYALETVIRVGQRCLRVPGEFRWRTRRMNYVLQNMSEWKWGRILERCVVWCVIFL